MRFNISDFQPREQGDQQKNKLDVSQPGLDTKDLGINLIKLPVSSLLGTLPAKHGADGVKFLDRIRGIQSMLNVGPHNRGRGFRAQGNQTAFAIRKSVHLLFDNVGILTDAAGKEFGALHDGDTDLLKTEILQKLPRNRFDCLPELDFAGKNVLKTSD